MIIQSGCIVSEYGWEGVKDSSSSEEAESNSRTTVLCVSFDHGAQRLFSGVRITLCCGEDIQTAGLLRKWKITGPLFTSVTNNTRSFSSLGSEDAKLAEPNASSLPIFNAIFKIEQLHDGSGLYDPMVSVNWQEADFAHIPFAHLTFKEGQARGTANHIVFEVIQPLTADTQNVSIPFTSSPSLYTAKPCGVYPSSSCSVNFGRVVRIHPIAPSTHYHRRTILPTDVLTMIFADISDSSINYRWWRRDLISSALVCKQWSCALNLLLSDFRHPYARRKQIFGSPPEIRRFAHALALRPHRGLSITHLSPDYFVNHASWRELHREDFSWPFLPLPQDPWRLDKFVSSFLSILHLAKNLRSLSISSHWLENPAHELRDALRELDQLEEVVVSGGFMKVHETFLHSWPSLKRLRICDLTPGSRIPPSDVPACPPSYVLQEACVAGRISDEQLHYLLSTSSSSLVSLRINAPFLTNKGLYTALEGVSKSLVKLELTQSFLKEVRVDEHALDSLIDHMERLESLAILPYFATRLMIERRSKAFQKCRLPTVELRLDRDGLDGSTHSLIEAIASSWAGWRFTMVEFDIWDEENPE